MSQSSNDCFPDRDAHRGGAARSRGLLAPALAHLHDGARRQRRRRSRDRQDRPHPHAGRDAADARPGILRLCRAGRSRHRAHARSALQGALSAGAGRHRGRHRAQCQAAIRQGCSRRRVAAITGLPFVTRAEQVRGARRRTTPTSSRTARSTRVAAGLFKIANDIRLLGSGPRSGPRRTDPAGERARLLDHAGQGQPDAVRGADHGLLPGVRQPDARSPSPAARAISSSTSTSR